MLTLSEYQILQAILSSKEVLYSKEILNFLQENYSKQFSQDYSIGALFTNLERLENKMFLSSYVGEKTKKRGGKAKRYYTITDLGRHEFHEFTNHLIYVIQLTTIIYD